MDTMLVMFIFVTACFCFYTLYLLFFERRYSIKNRLLRTGKTLQEYQSEEETKQSTLLLGVLKQVVENIEKSNYYANIRLKLLQAYIKMKPIEFIEISIMSGLFLGGVLFLLTDNGLLLALGFILGYRLPETVVESTRKKRAKQLNAQLPQALSLIANGLRAGFSFPQAMAVVSREMEAPIADEFAKVLRDNSYGKNMDEALQELAKRTDDEDLDILITTLLIHLQVGGDLSEILDTISQTIRERVKLKGDIHTLTSQSQMSAVVIGILPVAIAAVIFMFNPEYIGTLFTEPLGLMMLGVAVGMILVGAFALTKIVKVKL
ncbi:type ii secretion system (t2ss) protein f [Trichococcus palustris]|uniref:Type ii secretion system (T2ss) protein f n=1 Tax=Trichococcus palustris TaxID=140314 RepID=A0A143Y6I6_9LACT|nr:type II secretion system F family protein [Trichococcus palustris]CZQ80884.1 type ii secretion system (t2ss) protein f [Trichococcus palustris]SFK63688.1 tight adherence protein B [Trichococcus palustris]